MTLDYYTQMNQNSAKTCGPIKVAAYCRVSTDKEDQINSFESQKSYFRNFISHHPNWVLYKIFSDEGLSGTSTKNRTGFNEMIAAARKNEFDLVITKEISRFARNTLDSIYYTRMLKEHGIGVLFMNDNINTMEGDAELRLAIMSSIAQEESRKTSERVKWGQKRQMERGVVFGRTMLGYDIAEGKMRINEDGARIVRLIFQKFIEEGKGTHVIGRELDAAGIKPMRGASWQSSVILRILRNEKYCGDLVQKKTFTPNYLTHAKKYNHGQEQFIIIQNHHEPIISRETFNKANNILNKKSAAQCRKSRYSNRYPLSGFIQCGQCGASFVARCKRRKDGSEYVLWRCYQAVSHGHPHIDHAGKQVGCSCASIQDSDVQRLVRETIASLHCDHKSITNQLLHTIQMVIGNRNASKISEMISLFLEGSDIRFCSQLLDKIVVQDNQKIDVYLKFLPFVWSFSAKNN